MSDFNERTYDVQDFAKMNDNNFNKKTAEWLNQVLKPRGRKCCKLISFLMPITGFLSKLSEEEYSIIFVLETLSTLTISTKAYAALLSGRQCDI